MQRLDHQIAAEAIGDHSRLKLADILDPPRHQRWRHVLGEIKHHHFFRGIAHRHRIVDDQRLPGQPLQNVRAGDIAQIERRVLPHQDDIDVLRQIKLAVIAALEVIVFNSLNSDGGGPSRDPAHVIRQRLHVIMP